MDGDRSPEVVLTHGAGCVHEGQKIDALTGEYGQGVVTINRLIVQRRLRPGLVGVAVEGAGHGVRPV